MGKILQCKRCGKTFISEHYKGGAIDHKNWTSEHNLNAGIHRGIDYIVNNLDMREDNYCNVKDYNTRTQKEIIECTLIWLKENNYIEEKNTVEEYFNKKEKLFEKIFKDNEEFKKHFYYVVEINSIIDFYNANNLENKNYNFIKIKDVSNSKFKEHLAIKIENEIYILNNIE